MSMISNNQFAFSFSKFILKELVFSWKVRVAISQEFPFLDLVKKFAKGFVPVQTILAFGLVLKFSSSKRQSCM